MFKKYGDPEPIKGFYDDDLELKVCDKCGMPLTVVALDAKNNEILCTCNTNDADDNDEQPAQNS